MSLKISTINNNIAKSIIYIIHVIVKVIRYLRWNWGAWHTFHNTIKGLVFGAPNIYVIPATFLFIFGHFKTGQHQCI